MEASNNIDEILTRYLLNESGPEESSYVTEWIEASSENHVYFERSKKTLELIIHENSIEKINLEEEWNHAQELIATGASGDPESDLNMQKPYETQSSKKQRNVFRFILPAAVAASVIVLLFAGRFFDNAGSTQIPVNSSGSIEITGQANAVIHHEINSTGKIKVFSLPDGSTAKLSNNSELTYTEPVDGRRRDIMLQGEAEFDVVKNKAKPFTVNSDEISTTAVGTKFTVTAFENEKYIQVKLLEGKVLVKSGSAGVSKATAEYHLLPGQKLLYDRKQQTAKIRSFLRENQKTAKAGSGRDNLANDNPLLPSNSKKSWFMFNNQSMVETFHALEYIYDIKIVYEKKDVDKRYVIGTFSKSDSVENILQQIAVPNKLIVTKTDRIFRISKSQ